MSSDAFSAVPLPAALRDNLLSLGYTTMTPIQAQSLPYLLQGRDLIAKAQTGSGKTAAFALGLLARLNPAHFAAQALVMCPTRELADQVAKEIRRLARNLPNIKVLTLCGGMPLRPQAASLEHGAHVLVGTPGRIQDHLRKGTLNLERLHTLVLDEADRMLDMGFAAEVGDIIDHCPSRRQTLLFSATYPDSIRQLSADIQYQPIEVSVEPEVAQGLIEQRVYALPDNASKLPLLPQLLAHYRPQAVVVFCNTRADCQQLVLQLQAAGCTALALHGDLEQRDRDLMLVKFSNRSCPILVATDMAARGLDIKDLPLVINYELPHDPEVYVHRIGRTGRAGQQGMALSLVAPGSQQRRLTQIEAYQQQNLIVADAGELAGDAAFALAAEMVTLGIDAGRKHKLRPGDVLGALTVAAGLAGEQIGKIDLFDLHCYVAVRRDAAKRALQKLANGSIKGRAIKIRQV